MAAAGVPGRAGGGRRPALTDVRVRPMCPDRESAWAAGFVEKYEMSSVGSDREAMREISGEMRAPPPWRFACQMLW